MHARSTEHARTFEAPNAEAIGRLDVARPVLRFAGNPILTAHDVNAVWEDPGLAVSTVHNAGIAEHEGEVVMLFRSHLRTGVSDLGLARSADGLRGWRVADEPAMLPARAEDLFAEDVDRAKLVQNETGGIVPEPIGARSNVGSSRAGWFAGRTG